MVEYVDWQTHLDTWEWSQGEHVTMVGPTGCGKTTLARAILGERAHVAVIATKPRDPIVESLSHRGYRTIRKWPPAVTQHRVTFWPKIARMTDVPAQAAAIDAMLHSVYVMGGWCLYFDELRYVCDQLRLRAPMELLWQQARAMDVSIVAGAQRPAHVPLLAYSQATHLYLWRTGDERDLARVSEFGLAPKKEVMGLVARLDRHEVLYLCAIDGTMHITTTDPEG